jgi:hypothetical protein
MRQVVSFMHRHFTLEPPGPLTRRKGDGVGSRVVLDKMSRRRVPVSAGNRTMVVGSAAYVESCFSIVVF